MKILSIVKPSFEWMLLEANLINGKDPYKGISLEKFVSEYAANLATPEAAQVFMKKISRLLMADERFMYAVRELPPNAPDWARAAMEKGDLVYFNPTPELKDRIENVSHYVAALEQDMQSTDSNVKAIATRDFQGFSKAPTLDMLVQKSNEYFSRSAKKQEATDTDGMKKVLEAPGGFVWYVLEEPVAFYREGRTLKNCIGRVYTAESTKRTNTQIYVLRDSNNRSVVAARIVGKEMAEVKGSNNGPPIPRYMPAVQKLINTFSITLGSGGKSDVGNSGYYYHKGILYSRPQAVAKLIKTKKLFDVPDTNVVVTKVVSESEDLIKDLYLRAANQYWTPDPHVYEVRANDGDPIASFITSGKSVEAVIRYAAYKTISENEETQPKVGIQHVVPIALQMLVRQGVVDSIDTKVQRELLWQDKVAWDADSKTFSHVQSDRQHTPAAKGTHTLDVYTGEMAKSLVKTLQPPRHRVPTKEVKAVYTATVRRATGEEARTTDKILVVVELNDGRVSLFSVRGPDIDRSMVGYTRIGGRWSSEYARDGKTVNTLVALANEQGFQLPAMFAVNHGLSYANGQYVPLKALEPTKISGDPPAEVFDLRELDPFDKATVIARAISTNDTKPHAPIGSRFKFRGVTAGLSTVLSDNDDYDSQEDLNRRLNSWTQSALGGPVTAIYRVNITYGAGNNGGKVSLIANGKEITHIDSETLDHTWQSRDDYHKVSEQLNKFAEAHGLTFARNATSKSPQLRVNKGKIVPAEALATSRLERSIKRDKGLTSRVGVLTFADGYTAKKMSETDYGTWAAHGVGKLGKGMPWEISDADGNVKAIVMVTKAGDVSSMYTNPGDEPGEGKTVEVKGRSLPIVKATDVSLLKYVKRMAQEFNWSGATTSSQFTVGSNDNDMAAKYIRKASKRAAKQISVHRRYVGPHNDVAAHYEDSLDFIKNVQPLVTAGIFSRLPSSDQDSTVLLTLTARGEQAAAKLNRGETINLGAYASVAGLHPDYKRPPEPEPEVRVQRVQRVQREPREPGARVPQQRAEGGGSKADLALARFRQMTQANNGEMPSRSAFIDILTQPPFNMTPAGASTYHYNTKVRYMKERGDINENFSFIEFLTQIL